MPLLSHTLLSEQLMPFTKVHVLRLPDVAVINYMLG